MTGVARVGGLWSQPQSPANTVRSMNVVGHTCSSRSRVAECVKSAGDGAHAGPHQIATCIPLAQGAPCVVHLAATGDHGYTRRTHLGLPLVQQVRSRVHAILLLCWTGYGCCR